MVKSTPHHIAMALVLTLATATLPRPASAAAPFIPRFSLLPEFSSPPAMAPLARSASCPEKSGLPSVLAGAAIGLFSGYLLPRLLHYDHLRPPAKKAAAGASLLGNLALRPQVTGSGAGLSCELRF